MLRNHWPNVFREYPGQPAIELECLRAQYKLLSEFYVAGTQHKLLVKVEPMMDYVLEKVQQLSLQVIQHDPKDAMNYFDNLKNKKDAVQP